MLYDCQDDNFINDLVSLSASSLARVLTAKLNSIVDSKLQSVNINSSTYSNEVKQKLAAAIDSNAIYNRQQIDSLILQSSKIYKNK